MLACAIAAAQSLGQLAHASPEVIGVLFETLQNAQVWSVRRDAARLIGQFGQSDERTVQVLWRRLLDEGNYVRTACAQALAQLAGRFPDAAETIEKKLVQAIEDPEFDKPDSVGRSGHDYAYDGLWLMVVGEEVEGG